MGMICNVIRVSEQELNLFLENSSLLENKIYAEDSYKQDWFLDIDKSWDGINFILTGEILGGLENEPNVLQRALFSLQVIDEEQDLGFGPAQYLTSKQVKETSLELQKIKDNILENRIDKEKMMDYGIYPEIWNETESIEYLQDNFKEFQEFFNQASINNEAIISVIS